MRLRYFHRPHRRRKVRPRRHPIPDPIKIVLQIGLEVLDGPPVHPGGTLVRLDALIRLPHQLLRYAKRLSCPDLTCPLVSSQSNRLVARANKPQMSRPLRSAPITGASALLRAGPPACAAIGTRRLTVSAARRAPSRTRPHPQGTGRSIGTRLPTFRAEAADQAHAASMPDTAWPINGHPPGSSRSRIDTPVSMSLPNISALHQRFTCVRLPGPYLTALTPPFPQRSPRQSSANAA